MIEDNLKNVRSQRLAKFLAAMISRDVVCMYKHTQLTWRARYTKGNLRPFLDLKVTEALIHKEKRIGDAHYELSGTFVMSGEPQKFKANLICETQPYLATTSGRWGVNPLSIQIAKIIPNEEAEPREEV